mmetsp:Transcript_85076/g.216711  ORF Transcript_85076/g.216711 Transcript_85076/m.216711 type:complete len:285 (-) Transcript_85076:72-926(-)
MDGVPVNVQAEADFCCGLDLARLCSRAFLNCELARHTKAPLVIQLRRSRASMKLMCNGEAFISGMCTVEEARVALKKAARRCKLFGWPVKFKSFKVRLVRWIEPYRPKFPIDILALGQHPSAEIRQSSASQPLRVLLPCTGVGAAPAGVRIEGSFELEGEQETPDAGVWAEVSADGRTRFHGALSVEELKQALDVIAPILEDHRIQDVVDPRDADGDRQPVQRRGLGTRKGLPLKRRGAPLSREALELEEPIPLGMLVDPLLAASAAASWPVSALLGQVTEKKE